VGRGKGQAAGKPMEVDGWQRAVMFSGSKQSVPTMMTNRTLFGSEAVKKGKFTND